MSDSRDQGAKWAQENYVKLNTPNVGLAFEAKAREIASIDICDNPELVAAIAAALAEAIANDRQAILRVLGRAADGEWMASREVQSGGMTIAVSDDAYYNLEGALHDLKRQGADSICIWTIERVQAQIAAVVKYASSDIGVLMTAPEPQE